MIPDDRLSDSLPAFEAAIGLFRREPDMQHLLTLLWCLCDVDLYIAPATAKDGDTLFVSTQPASEALESVDLPRLILMAEETVPPKTILVRHGEHVFRIPVDLLPTVEKLL